MGAAAFTGAVTHTISISVIVFEMTGQITHAIPILIAVLVANAIAGRLGPSCYDSVILIKKLPYLPDIIPSSSGAYNFFVEDFMVRDIKYIWYGMTFQELRETLKENNKLRGFPLVDGPDQMVLLGSVQRAELITAIEKHIGKERRLAEASRRREVAREVTARQQEELRVKQLQQELDKLQQDKLTEDEEAAAAAGAAGRGRRPSRFAVSSVEEEQANTVTSLPASSLKGILKKQSDHSQTVHGPLAATTVSPLATPYQTISGAG